MSLQARIVKKLLPGQMAGWSDGSIEEQRARQEKGATRMRVPKDVVCQSVMADGVPAQWIDVPGADQGVILYLHGGAYTLGSINVHRELVARLVRATRMRGFGIDYRLAPEHLYPAALNDAVTAYRWLLSQGGDPARIVIAGDSAGGGLALAALVALRDGGDPLPAAAVFISPWADLAGTGGSMRSKARADSILDPADLLARAKSYAGAEPLDSPLVSPLYADFSDLPPLLFQVGTDEILLDDAVRCAERARQAGVDVSLQVWDGLWHVFQMFSFLPETKEAVAKIAAFVSQKLKPGPNGI